MDAENENKLNLTEEFTGHTEGISSLRKRKRKGRKKQFCRQLKTPFDPDSFAEFVLKLDRLKNLDWRDPTKPGQYIIRASCMGKVYGHFLSGVVDMAAFVTMSRAPPRMNTKEGCPDIDISETIVLHVLYKELIDNPVVLTLLDGRHPCRSGKEEPDFNHLTPIGYMCLDLLELVNNEIGFIDEYIEPWILHSEKKAEEKFQWGAPMLQFSVSCSGGLPEDHHLQNGNSMSLHIESMHRLPKEILQLEKFKTEINVFISLPVSDTEPYLVFPRGQIVDETSIQGRNQSHHHHHKSKHAKSGRMKKYIVYKNSLKHSHWASVLENWPEMPKYTAVIPGDTRGEQEHSVKELSGDMLASVDDDWKNHLNSSDPAIVWNTLHKIYIPASTYQKTLQDLSKNSTWPLEVSITINKEIPFHKPTSSVARHNSNSNTAEHSEREHSGITNQNKRPNPISSTTGKQEGVRTSQGSANVGMKPIPASNAGPEEPHFETIIVYHGIAFFDLTQLLGPGTKTIRFASRLYPYKDKLLHQKTTVRQSAFLTSIPGYLPSASAEVKLLSATASRHSQKKGTSGYIPNKAHESKSKEHHGHHQHEVKILLENKTSKDTVEELNQADSATSFKIESTPFIVFELTMDHAIVPLFNKDDAAKTVKEYNQDNTRSFPRRKVMNARMAVAQYRRSILQASAELCEIFHANYLEEVVNDPRNADMLDPDNPASSCDALKKGFLFYLNATGRYLILREHLRNSISHIIQQRCLILRPNGFQNAQDFQSYLHDMYIYLVDQMHDILTKTQMTEVDAFVSLSRLEEMRKPEKEYSKVIQSLRNYAEEALAQGDFDNCHRIHLERICKSEEDPNAWVDFATMWLSRGDDRMAEIAVREALRINPEHVYGLIIAGVIAAKHEDERAIDYAGSALGLHPTSPECMIILAMVYKTMNNDVAADYYFKYARYMHRVLTGGDTTDMEKEYNKMNAGFDIINVAGTKNLEELMKSKEREILSKSDHEIMVTSAMPSSLRMGGHDPRAHKVKQTSKSKIDSKSLKVYSAHELKRVPSVGGHTKGVTVHGQHHHRHSKGENLPPNKQEKQGTEETPLGVKDPSFTRRDSISGKPKLRINSNFVLPHILRPNFEFEAEFNDDALSKTLPFIGPSLQTPWDVTQPQLVSHHPKVALHSISKTIESKDKVPIRSAVPEEADKMSVNETEHDGKVSPELGKKKSIEENLHEFAAHFDELYGEDNNFLIDYANEDEEETEGEEAFAAQVVTPEIIHHITEQFPSPSPVKHHKVHPPEKIPNVPGHAHKTPENIPNVPGHAHKTPENIPKASSPENISKTQSLENFPKQGSLNQILKTEVLPGHEAKSKVDESTISKEKMEEIPRKVYSKKNGSEYIWTAQLLLQLRLFDFMDGVLAREVHLNEKRNTQYLYLRSMSLYLRHRSAEALVYINEALDLDPLNATLWALKGHCYYRLNKQAEAIESYERSLMLPDDNHNNQHLVYLRFGSLCLDQGGEDSSLHLAKKVFQRGVHMYPSPYMWLAYGNTCYQLKQYEEAENAFAEANRVDNTSPLIWGHLALVSLARGNQSLAEQSYKWAIRFGLRKGTMVDEIKRLQKEKGFGDPSFPRIPDCLPHDFYLRRVGRQLPFDMYKEALYNEPPRRGKKKYYDTEREMELKRRLDELKRESTKAANVPDEKFRDTDAEEEDAQISERELSAGRISKKSNKDKDKKKQALGKKHEDVKSGSNKEKMARISHSVAKRSTETPAKG